LSAGRCTFLLGQVLPLLEASIGSLVILAGVAVDTTELHFLVIPFGLILIILRFLTSLLGKMKVAV
jgi:hypothetical protein